MTRLRPSSTALWTQKRSSCTPWSTLNTAVCYSIDAKEVDLEEIDLIGPLMGKLASHLGVEARAEPGGLYSVNDEFSTHRSG